MYFWMVSRLNSQYSTKKYTLRFKDIGKYKRFLRIQYVIMSGLRCYWLFCVKVAAFQNGTSQNELYIWLIPHVESNKDFVFAIYGILPD